MKYEVKTKLDSLKIEQDLIMDPEIEGLQKTVQRRVFDTAEAQAQAALKTLGWISPEDVKHVIKVIEDLVTECDDPYGKHEALQLLRYLKGGKNEG